ncbi:MAG: hypothetical protein DRO99_01350 [Candidatus Aenigmatarchaeota archaeon]|nr:MAG: hypothetical protein DRO99_01350 [Candidatus Aenigmarchaeota archaeon]
MRTLKNIPEPRFIKNILLSNIKRLSKPYKLTLAVTYKCNSRCKTCNIWRKEPGDELDAGEIKNIFSHARPSWINITGGEPFLRDDLYRIFKAAKEASDPYILNITTNGMLKDKVAEELEKASCMGLKNLISVVSIDGPRKTNDMIRGRGAWKRAVKTYNVLRSMQDEGKLKAYIGYTISSLNPGAFPLLYEELKKHVPDIRIDDFHFNVFHNSSHYYGNMGIMCKDVNSMMNDISTIRSMRNGPLSPVKLLGDTYLKKMKDYMLRAVTMKCAALSSSCFINPLGDVYPCIHHDVRLGNLRDHGYDIKSIWEAQVTKDERERIKRRECPGCWTPCEAYQTILANLLMSAF